MAIFIFTAIQVWDVRLLLLLDAVAAAYYGSARIPLRAVRAQWAYVAFFITFIVVANTLITGGELRGLHLAQLHVYFSLPLTGTPISAESVTYAVAQYMKFGAMAAVGFRSPSRSLPATSVPPSPGWACHTSSRMRSS